MDSSEAGKKSADGLSQKVNQSINQSIKFILRNTQLQRAYNKAHLTAIHVMKRSIDLHLWIMVSGGWN